MQHEKQQQGVGELEDSLRIYFSPSSSSLGSGPAAAIQRCPSVEQARCLNGNHMDSARYGHPQQSIPFPGSSNMSSSGSLPGLSQFPPAPCFDPSPVPSAWIPYPANWSDESGYHHALRGGAPINLGLPSLLTRPIPLPPGPSYHHLRQQQQQQMMGMMRGAGIGSGSGSAQSDTELIDQQFLDMCEHNRHALRPDDKDGRSPRSDSIPVEPIAPSMMGMGMAMSKDMPALDMPDVLGMRSVSTVEDQIVRSNQLMETILST